MTFLSRIYLTLMAAVLLAFGGWLMSDRNHMDALADFARNFASGRIGGAPILPPAASEPYAPQVVYLKDTK